MREEKPWTIEAVQVLIRMARERCTVPEICITLGRSEPIVRAKMHQLGLTSGLSGEEPDPRERWQ